MIGKYNVITLCGSTRFKDAFLEAQKRLTLDEIVRLLHIEKIDLQTPKSQFLNIIGNPEPIEVKIIPLYILTDIHGKEYYI